MSREENVISFLTKLRTFWSSEEALRNHRQHSHFTDGESEAQCNSRLEVGLPPQLVPPTPTALGRTGTGQRVDTHTET